MRRPHEPRCQHRRHTISPRAVAVAAALLSVLLLLSGALAACDDRDSRSPFANTEGEGAVRAFQIEQREQLIGGLRALGEIGDYKLENDNIRVIVQDVGFSRGFGVFGGGVIDLDLRRPNETGDLTGGSGRDLFGEMFPGFFLQALAPERIEIINDGSNGEPARIRATGYAGDFLTLIKGLNDLMLSTFTDTNAIGENVLSSQIPCTFGRHDGATCTQDSPDGEQLRRCVGAGGLLCTPQCRRYELTNDDGDVTGFRWRVPGTEVFCNPGELEHDSCICVNNGQPVSLGELRGDETIPAEQRILTEVCADLPEDGLCDPACPDSGVFEFTDEDGDVTQTPCQRGRFSATSCQCEPVPGGGEGVVCTPECPTGQDAPNLEFSIEYELPPGVNYMKVSVSLTNRTSKGLSFPDNPLAQILLGVLPLGDVVLFSAGNSLFTPGSGFDLRRALDDSYRPENAPQSSSPGGVVLPGFITDVLATTTDQGVSYGVIVEPSERNVCWINKEAYEGVGHTVRQDSMLIPFIASAFAGVFYSSPPDRLGPGESFTFSKYVIVGRGDVASIMDTVHALRGVETETLSGVVVDALLGNPVEDVSVLLYRRRDSVEGGCSAAAGDTLIDGRPDPARFELRNQMLTFEEGRFRGSLEHGCYAYRVRASGRRLGALGYVDVQPGNRLFKAIEIPPASQIEALVIDGKSRPIPAKVTVVGRYDAAFAGLDPRDFLFDQSAGEGWRVTDLVPDTADDPDTRQYIEAVGYTDATGRLSLPVRPSLPGERYDVYISRGVEYELEIIRGVSLAPGQIESVQGKLRRVVDTSGYVSVDLHVHSWGSIDAPSSFEQQVLALAGEGVEYVASTDHNYVSNFAPSIAALGLSDHINSMVGLEMTTLEGGHFNGYPLDYKPGPILHGSFEWAGRSPEEVFEGIRALGAFGPENVIVQVNHPRDSILGYFDQYSISNLTGEVALDPADLGLSLPNGPAFIQYDENGQVIFDEDGLPISQFSWNFDAIEVFNGKRFVQLHSARVPSPEELTARGVPFETTPEGNIRLLYDPADQSDDVDLTEVGTVLLDEGTTGDAAFPGNVEDWFNLMNQGRFIAGLGNSDSHEPYQEEPGFPRNFVRLGYDEVNSIKPLDIVDAIRGQRVIATGGPFVEVVVSGDDRIGEIGDTVVVSGGSVDMIVSIQAPSWIVPDTLIVYVNGLERVRQAVTIAEGQTLAEVPITLDAINRDSWIVVEVTGSRSMFPVVPPLELPPLLLTDAVEGIGDALPIDLGSAADALRPSEVRQYTPYAITNPVKIDVDGNGFEALGGAIDRDGDTVVNDEDNCPDVSNKSQRDANNDGVGDLCEDMGMGGGGGGRSASSPPSQPTLGDDVMRGDATIDRETLFKLLGRRPGNRRDIRTIFEAWGHNH